MFNKTTQNYGLDRQAALNQLTPSELALLHTAAQYILPTGYYNTETMLVDLEGVDPLDATGIEFFNDLDEQKHISQFPIIELARKFNTIWDQIVSEAMRLDEQARISAALQRVKNKTHSNADLDLLVKVGLADYTYGPDDDNRPTGITILTTPAIADLYSDIIEEKLSKRI